MKLRTRQPRRIFQDALVVVGLLAVLVASILQLSTGLDAFNLSNGSRMDFVVSVVCAFLLGVAAAILASRLPPKSDLRRCYEAAAGAAGVAAVYATLKLLGSF